MFPKTKEFCTSRFLGIAIHEVIGELKKLIYKATKNNKSVLFAQGDNILFKAPYQASLLNDLQRIYK